MSNEEVRIPLSKDKSFWVKIGALVVLMFLNNMWYSTAVNLSGPKYWVFEENTPFFIILIIIAVVSRLSGKRIGPTFLALLFFTYFIVGGGKGYWFSYFCCDYVHCALTSGFMAYMSYMVYPPGAWETAGVLLPSWLIPSDSSAVQAWWQGSSVVHWGPLMTPTTTWALIYIALPLMTFPMLWLIFGPQWSETERISFPMSAPYIWTANTFLGDGDQRRYSRLFSREGLRDSTVKAFYIALIIGILLNLPFILLNVLPAIPLMGFLSAASYSNYPFQPTLWFPVLADLLPGAYLDPIFSPGYMAVMMLMPFDFIVTWLISNLVFQIIAPTVLIRGGIMAPELIASNYSTPMTWFSMSGMIWGLGIWCIWMARGRIKDAIASLTGKDRQVNGISMRVGSIIFLIAFLIYVGIFIGAGAPAVVAVVFLLVDILYQVGGARYWGEWLHMAPGCHGYESWRVTWLTGTTLGYWTPAGANPGNTALAASMVMPSLITCTGPASCNSPLMPYMSVQYYGATDRTHANHNRIFYGSIILLLLFIPFSMIWQVYTQTHIGAVNTASHASNWAAFNPGAFLLDTGLQNLNRMGPLAPETFVSMGILGIIAFFVIQFLRVQIPWFAVPPIAVMSGIADPYWMGWLNALLALIFKYILTKMLGPRRSLELTVPILAGFMVGTMILVPLINAVIIFDVCLPNLSLLWTP